MADEITMKTALLTLAALGIVQVLLPAQSPTITTQPESRVVWAGGSVRFTVGVSGAGPFSYQWQFDGTNLPNNIITTVAGGGTNYPDNGGSALSASLYPYGVTVDGSGNLFFTDGSRICKASIGGILLTIAGNGTAGYSGDGGAATNASLNYPGGLAVDASGNLFIPDTYNHRIRKVDTNGLITTVAGNGLGTYSGDGGAATNASFNYPQGIVLDGSGNFFIADKGNNRIRKVDASGIITTVAGSGQTAGFSGDGGAATNATLSEPIGVVVDGSGNLLIADTYNNRIRNVDTNGIITTVAGNGTATFSGDGGQATNASLRWPIGVVVDGSGNLLIADTYNNRIRNVDLNGTITTIVGNNGFGYWGDGGLATNAFLWSPWCVAADSFGDLFIADSDNNRIRKVTNTHGPTLGLNDVSAANAGIYRAVVTGPDGSVTSGFATLTVADAPLIYRAERHPGGSVTLYAVSQPGSTNVLVCATNLVAPVFWQPLSTNVAGVDGAWQFTDTNAVSWPMRFYRSVTE